jgi:cellulose synthase/poly-beta-1,6-N-acetylglucosamine synthase-like glycosyltransferase
MIRYATAPRYINLSAHFTALVMIMAEFVAWLFAFPVILALAIFSVETLAGLWPGRTLSTTGPQPETVILMPAHNEAETIAAIIVRLRELLSDHVSLLVVADNCTDATADIVRSLGHVVIERHDDRHRGKGFALAFGRDFLKQAPPQAVIILDADCETDAPSIRMLAVHALANNSAVQARYILTADLAVSPMVQISNFAFWLKNVVRQRGEKRLGGPAILGGTGMAFPWPMFVDLPLATPNIVEDLALGIYLTEQGRAPVYLDEAMVVSRAANEKSTLTQRMRWEHGFVAMARQFAFSALWNGLSTGNRKLFQLGLHLIVPPLALLFVVAITMLFLLALCYFLTGSTGALAGLTLTILMAGGAVILAWATGGRKWLGFAALLRVPLYMVWKIPLFLGLAKKAAPEWKRTERSDEGGRP